MASLIKTILDSSNRSFKPSERKITTFLNHYSYQIARNELGTVGSFDNIYCDGIFLCLFFRMLGYNVQRTSFDMTSAAPVIFEEASEKGLTIALVGGEPGIAHNAKQRFEESYPRLNIVFDCSGFFGSPEERSQAIEEIASMNPDIVICGMGTPLQESFLLDLRGKGWDGAGYTCGGFLHQTANKGVRYYPELIDKFNLRWFYRMLDEPKLVRRYTLDVFRFMIPFLADWIRYKRKQDI